MPSDASKGSEVGDVFAPSGEIGPDDTKIAANNSTIRAILTPALGGTTVRVRLSNRFGTAPVTFARSTIGKQASGARLAGPSVAVTFEGKPSVTAEAGQDVVSDPIPFSYGAFDNLAVSVYVAGNVGKPTEHYEGRQNSYFTPEAAGDHAAEESGEAFSLHNSTRPFVTGLEVMAPESTGAVVAFGDSITDGYQGSPPAGVPENPEGLDANGRYPDDLARRLIAAHIPLSVVNAGISGNRVLRDGVVGGGPDYYAPAALTRLNADVLAQAGVTTVIWQEGINDIGQSPPASAAEIVAGYEQGIARMHEAHLRVLMGTLTPAGENVKSSYGGEEANKVREEVNAWIRTHTEFIDFDAAVRDPSKPSRINPAYQGGDHLHFNLAGYQAMANAVNLALLPVPPCTPAGGPSGAGSAPSAGGGGSMTSLPGVSPGKHTTTPAKKRSRKRAKCTSLREFTIHIQNVRKLGVVSAQIYLKGRVLKRLRAPHLSAVVNLKGLPKGTFVLRITDHLRDGRVVHSHRTYHTCAPSLSRT